ncbi:MAG: glycoside hydrolase family 31 protein [Terriglobia bacterium]
MKKPQGLAKISLLALFIALAAIPAAAEWRSIGKVTVEGKDNHYIFRGAQGVVSVNFLAPDLVRVRMAHSSEFAPDYSWAVIKTHWPEVPVDRTTAPDELILRSSLLEARIHTNPFRIAFYDRAGRLISKDTDDQGMAWDGNRVRCWKWMPPDEHYFGLGEKAGPLDKRGHSYVMWNTDAYGWGATTDPLYETVPFFMGLRQGKAYGIFFDNTYRSSFDLGAASPDDYSFGAAGGEINYYFFSGPDPKTVLSRFTELVGRTPLPPRWAIGYHQSRYSYYPEKKVRWIADNFRLRHIPCDAIFLDIDYMDGYRIFTWDLNRFPHPAQMISDLGKEGFHIVTIIDPGVKVDSKYRVYQQGLAGNDFVKMPDGSVFIGKVWPGDSAFPDFTSSRVRTWWGSLYQGLIKDGVAGFWNDMNEPSVFEVPSKTMPLDATFYDHGLHSSHAKIHNVYGMLMSEGTRDGMLKARPNMRPLVITRDTYAGGQRYAAVWTGDNSSTWEHLRISLRELMTMGLSGLDLAGADIGGFALSPSPDLYTRWLEAAVFYPYCRTHTSIGTRQQDPWSYGNRREEINRDSIDLRYRLLPYLYNAFYQSSQTGLPVMRALLLDYPNDPEAVSQENEFLFGDDLLVAPVVKDGEWTWPVYLPAGTWFDFWSDRSYQGPAHIIADAPLDRIPLFVRGGAIIPTQQVVQYVDQEPINPITFEIYPDGKSGRDYYEDDGTSFKYQQGVFMRRHIAVSSQANGVQINFSARQGSYTPGPRTLQVKVHGVACRPAGATVDNQALPLEPSVDSLSKYQRGWAYDANSRVLWIHTPDSSQALSLRIIDGVVSRK